MLIIDRGPIQTTIPLPTPILKEVVTWYSTLVPDCLFSRPAAAWFYPSTALSDIDAQDETNQAGWTENSVSRFLNYLPLRVRLSARSLEPATMISLV